MLVHNLASVKIAMVKVNYTALFVPSMRMNWEVGDLTLYIYSRTSSDDFWFFCDLSVFAMINLPQITSMVQANG